MSLCRTCAETNNQDTCFDKDFNRQFTGTYVADKLRVAFIEGTAS